MKMNCKKFNDLIPSYHDGRLTARERTEFEHHKHACPECAGLLQDTVTIADVLKSTAEPVPLPDWDKSWRVIAATLTPRPDRKWRLALVPRWALVASGFLLFFILGIASARFFFSPSTLETVAPSDAPFLYSAQDYFAALQPVMASYANAPASQASSPADQTRVRQLLGDLYLLKLRAEKSRDASLQHLLGDIELVLLEIAHVDRSDPDQVRQVGAMIQEKGISLKMKVYRFEGRKSVRI
jgi:hypothetical protein